MALDTEDQQPGAVDHTSNQWLKTPRQEAGPRSGPQATEVLLLTGLGALFAAYYWDDNFEPGGLDYLVLNHLGGVPAGTRARSAQATHRLVQVLPEAGGPYARAPPLRVLGSAPPSLGSALVWSPYPSTCVPGPARRAGPRLCPVTRRRRLQVNFLSYVQLTKLALPSLTDSKGSLVVVSTLLGRVPVSFSTPYSAAKFALDSFFGSLWRELDVQHVNVAITMCVLGLQDPVSTVEGVRGVMRAKASPGPKAALAVIRGVATRTSCVFYPWRLHLLCLLRGWLPHPRVWFICQDLNISAVAA